jgi:hypothetical protein
MMSPLWAWATIDGPLASSAAKDRMLAPMRAPRGNAK